MRVVGISGFSNTGKTTLIVSLIRALKKRNYTVSTMKGIHLTNYFLNQPESDTWKHLEAGAETALARTQYETVQFWNRSFSFSQMIAQFHTDFVLVEGMKKEPIPKILCAKGLSEFQALLNSHVFALSGWIAQKERFYQNYPIYHLENELELLTDLVVEKAIEIESKDEQR